MRRVDDQLGVYAGEAADVGKSSGCIHSLRADVIVLKEAAYVILRAFSVILAAAHNRGTHVAGTYDLH